jgi:integrase
MARAINRLTHREAETISRPGMHSDGGGLYLQVTKGTDGSIRKSWLFRYSANGRERQMGLGPLKDVKLATARLRAAEARELRRRGKDPIVEREALLAKNRSSSAAVMTFSDCAKAYIASHSPAWRNVKHANQWKSTIETYCAPVFGKAPVQTINVSMVMQVIEPMWSNKSETASRVRGRIERVLDWAKVRGFRDGENPARWRGHLELQLPARAKVRKVKHHAALPHAEIPEFMIELRSRDAVAARALEFAILTAARTGEVIGAKWAEINLKNRIWTIPSDRMKAGREHRVPLSDGALRVLERTSRIRENEFLFPGDRRSALSDMALLMLLRRMGHSDITTHGFRSTFRDWVEEQTDASRAVAESALAHTIGDAVEAAYRRGDLFEKRCTLMAQWSDFCSVNEPQGANVAVLRTRAR